MTFPEIGRQGRLLVEGTDFGFWPASVKLAGETARLRCKQASGLRSSVVRSNPEEHRNLGRT